MSNINMYSAAIIFVCVRALFNVVIQQQTASQGKPMKYTLFYIWSEHIVQW